METKRALIYSRVSSDRQAKEGHGLDAQEHRCREFARSKEYEIEAVFRDSFSGGGDFRNRPGMTALLEYIDKFPHRDFVVLFDDLKRLARDTVFYLQLLQEFRARGVALESPNIVLGKSEEDEFVQIVLMSAAQLERKQNRRQVIQKEKARLEKGYWTFYQPPGYRYSTDALHGKLLVRDEPTASIIQEALEKYASGILYEQIDVLRFLDQRGYDRGRQGGKLYLETVKRLLTRPIYAGYIEYLPWEVALRPGHHKGLVSLETYKRIQDRLNGKVRVKLRKDMRDDFPLRGFILCHSCRRHVTASWSRGRKQMHPYYRCNQKTCQRYGRSIPKQILEENFEHLLTHLKPHPQVVDLTKAVVKRVWAEKTKDKQKAIETKHKQLLAVQSEIEALLTRATKATDDMAQRYEARVKELSGEEAKLRREVEGGQILKVDFETALEKVCGFVKSPYSKWAEGDLNGKRLVLRLVFAEDLAYHPETGFETARVSPILKLFTEIGATNSQDVEVGGVEPPCNIR